MTERKRRRHPLLGAFPLAVMALATFLAIFAVLMARLGATPATTRQSAARAQVAVASARAITVTARSSGAVAAVAPQSNQSTAAPGRPRAILTRTSGVGGSAPDHD